MKRYFSAALAAAALFALTGCEGREEPPTQVSTSDPSAAITSNYTSQSLQADTVTSSIVEKTIEAVSTESVSAETETATALSTAAASTSAETATAVTSSSAAAKTTTLQKQSSNGGGQAAETTSSSSSAVSPLQTTTTSATTSVLSETTTRPVPTHDEIIEAYINEVEKKIASMIDEGCDNISVSYTLYDMDKNGTPELVIKWYIGEDNYQDTFYTYDEFGTKVIFDGNQGSYSVFACDPAENRYVTAYYYTNQGEYDWLDYDGSAITPDVEQFECSGIEALKESMENAGIEQLPYAKYTYSGEDTTIIYKVVNGELESVEIPGRDFSFISSYEF